MALGTRTREQLTAALREARTRLVQTMAATTVEMETLEARDVGSRSDTLTATTATAVLARLSDRERQQLDDIDAAEARLAAGTFGVCVSCGRAIALARLRALPTAAFCISCEAERERHVG